MTPICQDIKHVLVKDIKLWVLQMLNLLKHIISIEFGIHDNYLKYNLNYKLYLISRNYYDVLFINLAI